MSSLSSLYLKKDTLKTIVKTLEKKGENGIEITISINDETNDYDQNVTAYVSQSKEDREAKKKRFYLGNGKCFWTNGTIKTFKDGKVEEVEAEAVTDEEDEEEDTLPF